MTACCYVLLRDRTLTRPAAGVAAKQSEALTPPHRRTKAWLERAGSGWNPRVPLLVTGG